MKTPTNAFKKAIAEKRTQVGLWVSLMGPLNTEICAAAGFDWLLLDAEHTPNDPMNVLQQAQVIAAYPGVSAVARIPMGHGYIGQALIKQYLDTGVQSLLVPMVDTPEQARELVRCMRYPPDGIRGMAATRASGWGRNPAYAREANREVCLLVQAETREALGAQTRKATPGTPSGTPCSTRRCSRTSSRRPRGWSTSRTPRTSWGSPTTSPAWSDWCTRPGHGPWSTGCRRPRTASPTSGTSTPTCTSAASTRSTASTRG